MLNLTALSSLNFANRTKKIKVREIENEPIFQGCSRAISGKTLDRQPLKPLSNTIHSNVMNSMKPPFKQGQKQAKAFSVYSDRIRCSSSAIHTVGVDTARGSSSRKRPSDSFSASTSRAAKRQSPYRSLDNPQPTMSKEIIEDIIEKKVGDILAARALDQPSAAPQPEISEEVQRRLDLLEQKVENKEDSREQGLAFLLMAKQHAVRGEHASTLRMYTLAKTYFPDNKKLDMKIDKLKGQIREKKGGEHQVILGTLPWQTENLGHLTSNPKSKTNRHQRDDEHCEEDQGEYQDYESDTGFKYKARTKKGKHKTMQDSSGIKDFEESQTPRTKQLLEIINRRDKGQIRALKGVGVKKAEAIVEALDAGEEGNREARVIRNLEQLRRLHGVSTKTVEAMRLGL